MNESEGLVALVGVMIPIVALLGVTFVLAYVVKLRNQHRGEMQKTIRLALEKGQELSPELIEQMTASQKKPRSHNLKVGLIWIAVALGFVGLGFGIPDEEARMVMPGVAALPFFVGLAYVIIWRFAGKD